MCRPGGIILLIVICNSNGPAWPIAGAWPAGPALWQLNCLSSLNIIPIGVATAETLPIPARRRPGPGPAVKSRLARRCVPWPDRSPTVMPVPVWPGGLIAGWRCPESRNVILARWWRPAAR